MSEPDDRPPPDLARYRRALNDAIRDHPHAEFLLDTRFLLDSYERLVEERKLADAERYSIRQAIRSTLDQLRE